MNLIFTKNIELQDAKYKLVSNNNNETSIFIAKDMGESIGLEDDKEFTFYLEKENIFYTLFNTFNYSVENNLFEKRDTIRIDYRKVLATIEILKNLPENFVYRVKVSVNGNRFYLKELRQENGFNIRDILIGGLYKLNFYKNNENKIFCEIKLKELGEVAVGDDENGLFDHFPAEFSDQEIIHSFAEWLNAKPKNNYFENDYRKTVLFLNRLQEKYSEAFAQSPFEVDFEDLEGFVSKIDRNIWDQESEFWLYSQATSNHLPRAVLNKDNYQAFLREFHNRSNQTFLPKNTIYYGAPGTGKSYIVDQKIKNLDPTYFERVTFHPEYDNAAFIGGYKPVSTKNEEGKDEISYRFVPQAFSSIYSRAWADPDNQYYLVIEEINRGNCAEIFGEIFQLLDRNSGYTVTPSKELYEHLLNKFSDTPQHPGIAKGLKLPPNLNIIATMNTSDQSLFPMDSAFKRRWEWEYVPICYDRTDEDGELNPSYDFEIDIEDGRKYRWIDFISKINNNHIKNNPSLGMDKCIGNYFIKPDNGNSITLKPFINKVIFYLWNDVFKDEDNKVFEPNGSYEDFFPVTSAGKVKIKELFERIELSPVPGYGDREAEEQLGRVAEENQTLNL